MIKVKRTNNQTCPITLTACDRDTYLLTDEEASRLLTDLKTIVAENPAPLFTQDQMACIRQAARNEISDVFRLAGGHLAEIAR